MTMCVNGTFGARSPHDRSARPTSWVHLVYQPTMEFKFHHVISWDSLRDTWQALLELEEWNALEAFINAVGITGASMIRGKLRRDEALTTLERDTIFERVSWPGWNIVQGPGNRTDEGGSDIDLFTEGMVDLDKERQVTLGLLWIEMNNLLSKVNKSDLKNTREAARDNLLPDRVTQAGNVDSRDAASRLERAFNSMSKFKTATFIPYTHSMWDTVSAGAVRRGAIGAWEAVPAFQKTSRVRNPIGNLPANMRCTRCAKTFPTPAVAPRVNVYCVHCGKQTMVDFDNAI